MKKRGLVISLLVMLAVITSGFTYAFWSSTVREGAVASNNVTIGEAKTATFEVTLSSETSGSLVPVGQVANSLSGAVEYVLFSFNVIWQDNFYASGDLSVLTNPTSVLIGGVGTNSGLVNFEYQVGGTVNAASATAAGVLGGDGSVALTPGTAVPVYVLVTLSEPGSQAVYEAIFGDEIVFDVDFSVINLAE